MFLLLALLFGAPLVAAWLVYFKFPEWRPEGTTNYGQLINPAQPIPQWQFTDAQGKVADSSALKGKWSLLYLAGAECVQSCQEKIFQIRQIRTLLNQERERVQRVYIAFDAGILAGAQKVLGENHPDLVYLVGPGNSLREFFQPPDPDAIYLLDPLGNWLMVYPAASDYKGMLKDLKKLLKLSHIG